MAKRKTRKSAGSWEKRAKLIVADFGDDIKNDEPSNVIQGNSGQVENHSDNLVQVDNSDIVERRVDLIIKDTQDNCRRSITIEGAGLGVEKTIAVVEALKRNYISQGIKLSQNTAIKAIERGQPHIQVILTLLDKTGQD